ncbi:MAG: hypothetical protein QS748_12020 [Candidatus Endonucleobacter bathymodioli]|uniref:Uncharacterized protein n=1 Tax=Candidatus Endonucleibacter bathymodioli TaxID=539814 RepID=A0AA90NXU3_9GAMM|nr:hypothetical protein [Candidatus Endonucleobacter bathymodioli]
MREQINSKIMNNITMFLMVLLSFFQFSQSFAGLEVEEVYIKDNITVVLTEYSIFTADSCCTEYNIYNICTKSRDLYKVHSQDNDIPLAVVVSPAFWDVGTQNSEYYDLFVAAVQALSSIKLDLNIAAEWSIHPGLLDNQSNTQKMCSSRFYVKKAADGSDLCKMFYTKCTYAGFANIRSDKLSQNAMDKADVDANSDVEYIKKGESYTHIKQGLSKLLAENPDVTKLHVYLPVLHDTRYYDELGIIASEALCDKFINNINDELKISSVIYIDLLNCSDTTIKHMRTSLNKYGFKG